MSPACQPRTGRGGLQSGLRGQGGRTRAPHGSQEGEGRARDSWRLRLLGARPSLRASAVGRHPVGPWGPSARDTSPKLQDQKYSEQCICL